MVSNEDQPVAVGFLLNLFEVMLQNGTVQERLNHQIGFSLKLN